MYCPILRSKQFELTALRELISANLIPPEIFLPIIEPVRNNLEPLIRTILALNEFGVTPLVIINPSVGDFSSDFSQLIAQLLNNDHIKILPCIIVKDAKNVRLSDFSISGSQKFSILAEGGIDRAFITLSERAEYTIVEHSKINPLAFARLKNVIAYEDAFQKKPRNSDYKDESPFSYLHAAYKQTVNVVGFGDYTILPREFSEGGGPAYVVTIHMSYIDDNEFDEMYIRHYSSFSDDTPTNPQGKFLDALGKLISDFGSPSNVFYHTSGIDEFVKIYSSNHYPGLGQVKKIAIKHHIETICQYLTKDGKNE